MVVQRFLMPCVTGSIPVCLIRKLFARTGEGQRRLRTNLLIALDNKEGTQSQRVTERRFAMRFGRKGIYKGKTYTFTHWNPKTNEVWGDDILERRDSVGLPVYGKWVSRDKVKFL